MRRNITPTIESGLLVAITVLLGLVTVYVPLIGMLVEFFCAVPLAILTARQGAGKGLTALVVTSILLSMLISPLLAIRIVLRSNFGLVRSQKFQRRKNFLSNFNRRVRRAGFIVVAYSGRNGHKLNRGTNRNSEPIL